jgi:hypothetical protein
MGKKGLAYQRMYVHSHANAAESVRRNFKKLTVF